MGRDVRTMGKLPANPTQKLTAYFLSVDLRVREQVFLFEEEQYLTNLNFVAPRWRGSMLLFRTRCRHAFIPIISDKSQKEEQRFAEKVRECN